MNLDTPKNSNYAATVVRLPAVRRKLEGLDNLEGASIFGFEILVSKDTPDVLGVFFPAETQISDEFCYHNNLYRHGDRNSNPDVKGYFEDNRRVRAIKFRGATSNGFWIPLDSLKWTRAKIESLVEGDTFDFLNGKEICRKYTVPKKEGRQAQELANRGFVRADKKFFPEHIDTENFFRNADVLDKNAKVIVTQKLHGTSIRIGHTLVNRKPTFVERVAKWFGAKIQDKEYTNLYGSRKVIKDANNPNQDHFYETDIWTHEGRKLDGILPENYIVYAELVGWTPDGKEIQKNYTYDVPPRTTEMYVYRIAIVNERGLTTDLSWEQVKEFCVNNGLKYTPEIFQGRLIELIERDFALLNRYMNIRYHDELKLSNTVYLGENKDIVDEGVCIRIDGLTPRIYKAKCSKFLEHETNLLDKGEEDLESSQNT